MIWKEAMKDEEEGVREEGELQKDVKFADDQEMHSGADRQINSIDY